MRLLCLILTTSGFEGKTRVCKNVERRRGGLFCIILTKLAKLMKVPKKKLGQF